MHCVFLYCGVNFLHDLEINETNLSLNELKQ